MEFARKELYALLGAPKPLWVVRTDLSEANLITANLGQANLSAAGPRTEANEWETNK